MKIRLIGDVHGKYRRYKGIIKNVENSIQVGDLGVGFYGTKDGEVKLLTNPPYDAMTKANHRFIRGNHDNPQACCNHTQWITDGDYLYDKIFCLGGAVSIDRVHRTEGLDWWPDEELSTKQLDLLVDEYIELKPDIVVTHDCPESIAREVMSILNIWDKDKYPSRTRQALESMFYHHKPTLWVFGHWHKTMRFISGGTTFQCLGELDFIDIDLEKKGYIMDD